ncbi:GmrSD restriction endonuclease domain-containing protein [Loktanella sp. DJP18]|uniref:GmrSD restriction endonuclease domain-containing protein n=1 Tax=Loktanella sp. DJP18 TaxID=3409788 RepID=UPI003BB71270
MITIRSRVASTLAMLAGTVFLLAAKIAPFTDDAVRQISLQFDTAVTSTRMLSPADDALRAVSYDRKLFGYGTKTRHELLKAHAVGTSTKLNEQGLVTDGLWRDAYTGQAITDVTEATIDHVVPLRWAWDHGAKTWQKDKLIAFGNDSSNLVVTGKITNSAKGSAGPGEWYPDDLQSARLLLARQAWIVKKYGLGS